SGATVVRGERGPDGPSTTQDRVQRDLGPPAQPSTLALESPTAPTRGLSATSAQGTSERRRHARESVEPHCHSILRASAPSLRRPRTSPGHPRIATARFEAPLERWLLRSRRRRQ